MIYDAFVKALGDASGTASNTHLVGLTRSVKAVDEAARLHAEILKYESQLMAFVSMPNFALNPVATEQFTQALGEAQFWILCEAKGTRLTRVAETSAKTPDFELSLDGSKLSFEVKTLSVVDGSYGVANTLGSSLRAQIDIERQQVAGKAISIAVSEVRPYGNKSLDGKPLTSVIKTLIDKAAGNIKAGQYSAPNSFLVLNLSVIQPTCSEPEMLRPSYPGHGRIESVLTGELWMLAFGKPGMLIQGEPEFEGKPAIEGEMPGAGLLVNEEFSFIKGLLLMITPFDEPTMLWGLFKNEHWERWNDDEPNVVELLHRLTGETFNDDLDTYGFRLHSRKPESE